MQVMSKHWDYEDDHDWDDDIDYAAMGYVYWQQDIKKHQIC